MRRVSFSLALISGVTLIAAAGCGTSGSNPVLYPEVAFQVSPTNGGQATFRVEARNDQGEVVGGLVADGVRFGFAPGTTFTTTGKFSFYLEGAAPPYSGTFVQQGNAPITVEVFRNQKPVDNANNVSMGDGTTVVVTAVDRGTPVAPPPVTQLVRFDVCAPTANIGSCSTTSDPPGAFGTLYSGSLGDPFTSHLLVLDDQFPRTTPSIYFLQNARDSASAVFRSPSNELLQAQLFVDNTLRQTASGSSDNVVLNVDL